MPPSPHAPRHTGRGLVIHEYKLLLIERWRDGLHYFSIPGGGIEPGETPEQTAEREIYEETSIRVRVLRRVYEMRAADGTVHHIHVCEYLSGEPALRPDSEEARNTALGHNRFRPIWVPLTDLQSLPFMFWDPVARQLAQDVRHGFPRDVKVLAAA